MNGSMKPSNRTEWGALLPMVLVFAAGFVCNWVIGLGGGGMMHAHVAQSKAVEYAMQDVSPITAYDTRFFHIAAASGTDKVQGPAAPKGSSHHYDFMYQKYLGDLPEDTPLRILEIGLGCVMWRPDLHPPGSSFKLWRTMFPKASISYIELDEECAEKHRGKIESTGGRLFTGSQTGDAVLAAVRESAASDGAFDMIVDDGSHAPRHQLISLKGLWSTVRPGGLYMIEDLLTSYHGTGDTRWDTASADKAIMPFIKLAVDNLNCRMVPTKSMLPTFSEHCKVSRIEDEFASIDCAPEICALTKRHDATG